MPLHEFPELVRELETVVKTWTSRRVRNLRIELTSERVVLRGRAASYHVKQLAQHGVRELLPHLSLENTIAVGECEFQPLGAA